MATTGITGGDGAKCRVTISSKSPVPCLDGGRREEAFANGGGGGTDLICPFAFLQLQHKLAGQIVMNL
jgi:hypothetical protein